MSLLNSNRHSRGGTTIISGVEETTLPHSKGRIMAM
jgi:hypothetical protein